MGHRHAFVAVVLVATASCGAPQQVTTTTSPIASPSPTTSTTLLATTAPPATPAPPPLTINHPLDGQHVTDPIVVFAGLAWPGCEVKAAGGNGTVADPNGNWSMTVELRPGSNVVMFGTDCLGGPGEVGVTVHYDVPRPAWQRVDLPPVPPGSQLIDLTAHEGTLSVLVSATTGWEVWRSSDGRSWAAEELPAEVFEDADLRTVASLSGTTFVAGELIDLPAVWTRDGTGSWVELEVERIGAWGTVNEITACGGRVVFTGHDSASNQVIEYRLWTVGKGGHLEVVFGTDSGPPGTGLPGPLLYCRGDTPAALVTSPAEPVHKDLVSFAVDTAVWSSPDGSAWSSVATGVLPPGMTPEIVVLAGPNWIAVSPDMDVAATSDGVDWSLVEGPHGVAPHGSYAIGGSGCGAVVVDMLQATMWWSPDGIEWERVESPSGLDERGLAVAGTSDALVLLSLGSFADATPTGWVGCSGS